VGGGRFEGGDETQGEDQSSPPHSFVCCSSSVIPSALPVDGQKERDPSFQILDLFHSL
jgi:hypothetical protein